MYFLAKEKTSGIATVTQKDCIHASNIENNRVAVLNCLSFNIFRLEEVRMIMIKHEIIQKRNHIKQG